MNDMPEMGPKYRALTNGLWECSDCGAAIVDRFRHSNWHLRIIEVMIIEAIAAFKAGK